MTSRSALEVPGVTVAGLTDALLSSTAETGAGTRMYMAPEVIEGRATDVRSDLYSLGVVLYQMAAGDFSRALAPGWERSVSDALIREDIGACVDGDPERRLAGPAALAERLRALPVRRARVRTSSSRRSLTWLTTRGMKLKSPSARSAMALARLRSADMVMILPAIILSLKR